MTTETIRSMPGRMAMQLAAVGGATWDVAAALVRDRDERWRHAAARLSREALVALRRAEGALALACDEAGDYFAAGDTPRERHGYVERLLREALFLEPTSEVPNVSSGAFRRVRYLCVDVFVALAGILVAAAGLGLVGREPHLFGRSAVVLFGLSFVPFLLLGVSSLRGLSDELSERRALPRLPLPSRSAAKKRLRALKKRSRRRAA